jgi:AraC-like DNA-binding protein
MIAADPLSDVLGLLNARSALSAHLRIGGAWSLGDRRVGAAIHLLHGEPARNWTLQELAQAAGMSRSNFALRGGTQPVSAIAFSLGYQSESAFSHAFKRMIGAAPQQYRRQHRIE